MAVNEAQLVRENESIVLYASKAFAVSEASKDDMLQEGRIALLRAVRTWDPARNTLFRTYAAHVVRNAMIDFLATQRRAEPVDCLEYDAEQFGSPPTQEEAYQKKEETRDLRNAIEGLPSLQRTTLLRKLEGVSDGDIAEARGCVRQSTAQVVKGALPMLRHALRAR